MENRTTKKTTGALPSLGNTGAGYTPIVPGVGSVESVERLHKQPRGYLKTMGTLVGRATGERTLFTLPEAEPAEGGNFREVISKNTAILGNYLLQLWQQNGEGTLVIDNLSPIAEMMGNTNHEIKIYLLYLGGYTYPIVELNQNGGMTYSVEQLFKIKFNYGKETSQRYLAGNYTAIMGGDIEFLKGEPIESISIEPHDLFIKAMEGKGLSYIFTVNDKFVKLALSLTDIAYKILTYSASNKPYQKIGEDNLVRHLGLEKQIKTQGKNRIRATILKGLQELQDKEHIKSYSYEGATGMYSFTYSDKFVRHPETKKALGE